MMNDLHDANALAVQSEYLVSYPPFSNRFVG